MKKVALFLAILQASSLFAFIPEWCAAPPGSRARYDRHVACCEEQNNGRRGCSTPCCYQCFWGGFAEVGADFLYWRSTRPAVDVWSITTGTPVSATRTVALDPGYDPGGRVWGALYTSDRCSFLKGAYTFFRSRHAMHLSNQGGLLAVTFIPPINLNAGVVSRAASRRTFYYQAADLVIGHYCCKRQTSSIYVFGGGRWVDIWEKQRTDLTATANVTNAFSRAKYDLDGGGIQLGLGGSYCFTQGVFLEGHIAGLGIIGQRRSNLTIKQAPAGDQVIPLRFTFEPHWGVVPGLDVNVTLRYMVVYCGLELSAHIGYEVHQYFNAIQRVLLQPAGPQRVSADSGFAGPFAGVNLRF